MDRDPGDADTPTGPDDGDMGVANLVDRRRQEPPEGGRRSMAQHRVGAAGQDRGHFRLLGKMSDPDAKHLTMQPGEASLPDPSLNHARRESRLPELPEGYDPVLGDGQLLNGDIQVERVRRRLLRG